MSNLEKAFLLGTVEIIFVTGLSTQKVVSDQSLPNNAVMFR